MMSTVDTSVRAKSHLTALLKSHYRQAALSSPQACSSFLCPSTLLTTGYINNLSCSLLYCVDTPITSTSYRPKRSWQPSTMHSRPSHLPRSPPYLQTTQNSKYTFETPSTEPKSSSTPCPSHLIQTLGAHAQTPPPLSLPMPRKSRHHQPAPTRHERSMPYSRKNGENLSSSHRKKIR